jgi:hypothetical protein
MKSIVLSNTWSALGSVPDAILDYLTNGWCRNVTRIFPPENFLIAFQETSTAVVEAFGDLQWFRFEILFSDSTAFRMNCFGLLRPALTLSTLL